MTTMKRSMHNGRRPKSLNFNGGGREVPLQIMVPESIRRQVAMLCADRGENIRTTVLRGLRAVGVQIAESELADRRGRRRRE